MRRNSASAALLSLAALLAACGGSDEPPSTTQPPTIESFTVTPSTVELGAPAVLQWDVRGADTVSINQGIGNIPRGTVFQVRPATAGSTVYTLSASNDRGSATATVTLTARVSTVPPSAPIGFTATHAGAEAILLSWPADANASGYVLEWSSTLSPQFQSLATTGGDRYWFVHSNTEPNTFHTYRLRATNNAGQSANALASAVSMPPPPEGPILPIVTPSSNVTALRGFTINFVADQFVTWRLLDGPGAGTISNTGSYVAPAAVGTYWLAVNGETTLLVPIIVQ